MNLPLQIRFARSVLYAALLSFLFAPLSDMLLNGFGWHIAAAAMAVEDDDGANLLDETKKAPRKQLPPSADAQRRSEQTVREIYADDYSTAIGADKKLVLSKTLLEQAAKTTDVSDRWVLVTESLRLATEAGDLNAGGKSLEVLAREFSVDSLLFQLEMLTKLAQKPTPKAIEELARACLKLAENASESGHLNSGIGAKSLAVAVSLAKRSKNQSLLAEVTQGAVAVREHEKDLKETAAIEAELESSLDDPDICLKAGKHYCFKLDDWPRGLILLAKGSDTDLSRLAVAENNLQNTAAAVLTMADAWYQWSTSERGATKSAAEDHARGLYEKTLKSLTGLELARVEKRIASLATNASDPTRPAKDGPKSIPGLFLWLDATVSASDSKAKTRDRAGDSGRIEVWKDLSGSGNDARQPDIQFQPKQLSDSVQFDGTRFLSIGRAFPSSSVSVMAVYRPNEATTETNLVSTRSASDAGWMIDHQAGDIWFRAFGNAAGQVTVAPAGEPMRVFFALINDNGAISAQLNGKPVVSATVAGGMAKSGTPLTIGKPTGNSGGKNFQGELIRLVVYARAISPAEITALMAWTTKTVRR